MKKFSDLEIVEECIVLLFDGVYTTSNTLIWTMYETLKHPEIYKSKNRVKILRGAILVSMRMNPIASGALLRVMPKGGIAIRRYCLTKNILKYVLSIA
ncbi:hypothetical protein CONCODRAFT_2292 [Conidiobolus coronatus NRRL 28638]|uniref:Cytochrome P450 n=1 Tax=Conidiobolus coronatus (strain ATCC 28846 / CBS 209.66 / NRRL 28638) TaxID=796925 RepID=A0A137PIA4_CONC2|nr:hypothetical protein CONCODRAFT_2292 [Conidiobolus coronatus NRRL 28638]|eukprot:KXN74728.1 hypothetical protein CONCODRAFT_2292 [Conidiobolus coronatus NRRL 28638]